MIQPKEIAETIVDYDADPNDLLEFLTVEDVRLLFGGSYPRDVTTEEIIEQALLVWGVYQCN